jgi:prevent-host-death family protein
MRHVNTHEAKTKLSQLLAQVEKRGVKIGICRNGKPIAMLVPFEAAVDPLVPHRELCGVKFREDPAAPLAEEDWPQEAR